MNKLKCIIIDDEPLARDVISNYIKRTPFLQLEKQFDNAWSLRDYLESNYVDLVFLDIQMPELDGLTFLKTLEVKPHVIFVSAHREYALEAFEVNVLDYLLKPVSYERFLKSINKLQKIIADVDTPNIRKEEIFLSIDRQMIKYNFNSIYYLEAQGDYVKIYAQDEKPKMTKKPLKEFMEELPQDKFIQIHRSFLINKDHISAYTSDSVKVADTWLKISRSFKEAINF